MVRLVCHTKSAEGLPGCGEIFVARYWRAKLMRINCCDEYIRAKLLRGNYCEENICRENWRGNGCGVIVAEKLLAGKYLRRHYCVEICGGENICGETKSCALRNSARRNSALLEISHVKKGHPRKFFSTATNSVTVNAYPGAKQKLMFRCQRFWTTSGSISWIRNISAT